MKTKEKTKEFTSILSYGGKSFKVAGSSIVECLKGLKPILPSIIKARAFLTVKSGKKSTEISFNPHQLRRLLVNGVFQEVLQKRLLTMMK